MPTTQQELSDCPKRRVLEMKYLVVWKAVKISTGLNMLCLQYDVSVPSSRSGRHDVFIECERNESNK